MVKQYLPYVSLVWKSTKEDIKLQKFVGVENICNFFDGINYRKSSSSKIFHKRPQKFLLAKSSDLKVRSYHTTLFLTRYNPTNFCFLANVVLLFIVTTVFLS